MGRIREQVDREAASLRHHVVDVRIRRADLPEQNSQAVYQRMQTERQREAAEFRAQGSQRSQEIRAARRPRRDRADRRGDRPRPSRSAARATPSATASSPRRSAGIRTSSPSIARCRPTRPACSHNDTRMVLQARIRNSSAISSIRRGKPREQRPARRAPRCRPRRPRRESRYSAAASRRPRRGCAHVRFLVALGLVFVIEGMVFAAFPATAKRAMASVLRSPDASLRMVGHRVGRARRVLVWLVRG